MEQETGDQTFLAAICAAHDVRHFIISPGSRSAPLTIALSRHPDISVRMVVDERAAAFIALGMAQQLRQPVGLVCTSGTAALNFAPAIAEAFYQRIPLLVFTADRPPEWIDQQDGQTLHQQNLYAPHSRGEFEIPVDTSHPDAVRHAERVLSEAIIRTQHPVPGPVHINIPLREPLYPKPNQPAKTSSNPKIIRQIQSKNTLLPTEWEALRHEWQSAKRRLIVGGAYPPNTELTAALSHFATDPRTAIIADITANLPVAANTAPHADAILGGQADALAPDLVITFGNTLISKNLKLFLRKHRPAHWRIDPAAEAVDTFQSLTRIIPADAADFFRQLIANALAIDGDYRQNWLNAESQTARHIEQFLNTAPFSEFAAVRYLLRALPAKSDLQLSNSMPVRYANLLSMAIAETGIRVNSNRGVSGIDGCTGTAVGAALATSRLTTLISGDLAFFYDRNSLWHNYLPANLRIVVLNNGGGGIFKLIDGPSNLPPAELETHFFTPHNLTARNTAADFRLAYFSADSALALENVLPQFFAADTGAAILEVFSDSNVNTNLFWKFKNVIRDT